MSETIASVKARSNALKRHHGESDPLTISARQTLKELVLAEKIRAAVESAPPLSPAQLCRLQALLSPSGGGSQ